MKLYVVRHGQTIWNVEKRVQGITDIPLTDKGRSEAESLQGLIKTLNIDVVISSPLERARETAKILVDSKLPINTDDRIKERDWGLNEGAFIDEVDRIDCWDVILNTKVQNIECIQDFMYRVSSFIEDIKVRFKDKNVLVVTHSAVSRVIHYMLGNIPEDGDLSKKDYTKKINSVIDIDKLPKCTKISVIEGGYETLWTSVFVKPLAWVLVNIGKILGNSYGLSIIIVTLLIRLILFPITFKSLKQSENIKKAQPKLARIEKKYANKTDQESMMMKSNEMMAVYKEFKINPIAGCLLGFIQIPLFFAFYEALNRLPLLFEGKFLGLHMGITPLAAAEVGNWYYLILPILVGLVTYFSFKMNKNTGLTSPDQTKQMNLMFNIMIVVIFVTSFSMSTAIILYWIANSLFTIIQNIIVKRSK